jgi:positive regulator of sigma E activity
MITLYGQVVDIKDDIVEVELQENSEICKKCHAHGLCGVDYQKRRIKAKNICQADKGNTVVIMLNSNNSLRAAFVFYIVPLLIFFILYFMFALMKISDKFAIMYSGLGFIFIYVVIFLLSKNRKFCDRILPIAVDKILRSNSKDD